MDDLEYYSTTELINELTKRWNWAGILAHSTQEVKLKLGEQGNIPIHVCWRNLSSEGAIKCLEDSIKVIQSWGD